MGSCFERLSSSTSTMMAASDDMAGFRYVCRPPELGGNDALVGWPLKAVDENTKMIEAVSRLAMAYSN